MHPLDTKRFKIFYDTCQESSLNAEYCLNKCLDLRCSSRVSRDLISLSLKCFSAQTYLMNSHIINSLPEIPARDSVPDLLLELNSVKKELSNSLLLTKQLTKDKKSLESQLTFLEEEMQTTIKTYKHVIIEEGSHRAQETDSAEFNLAVLIKEKAEF